MKNKDRKLISSKGYKPLKNLLELNNKREVFGVGFDGCFQKGIITEDNRHVKFENEFGGTKVINEGWVELTKQFKTVYSGLYIE